MSGLWLDVALVAVLVLINAVFAGSEMALVSLREGQLRQLEREGGSRASRLVRLARDPNRFLATIQIGITLAGFLASATAAASLAEPLVPYLGVFGDAAEAVAVAGITLVLSFLTLVLGELTPKRLAMQRALPWALVVARPLDVLSTLSRPFVALLGVSTNTVVRLLGGRPEVEEEPITPGELRDLVTSHHGLDDEQREIISGALEIHERTLREVLLPRGSVFVLDARMTLTDARSAMAEAGHSRVPVVQRHHLDSFVGVIHWSDVIRGGDAPVVTVSRPAMLLPETARITGALRQFKAARQQLALVVDEHGAVDGIVTLEDLLEELVGEIWDEADPDIRAAAWDPDGSITLPGTFPIHDLPDIGIQLPEAGGGYATVAGLALKLLGRLPTGPGDRMPVGEWELEVTGVEGRAVREVRLHRRPLDEAAAEESLGE